MRVCNSFYNLALIDIRLPDMEGTELLWGFQQLGLKTKKIVITGYSTEEYAINSLNLGADGYLKKPVMPGKLLEFVADKLAEQEAEDTIVRGHSKLSAWSKSARWDQYGSMGITSHNPHDSHNLTPGP